MVSPNAQKTYWLDDQLCLYGAEVRPDVYESTEVRLYLVFESICDLCERNTFIEHKNTVTELWVLIDFY